MPMHPLNRRDNYTWFGILEPQSHFGWPPQLWGISRPVHIPIAIMATHVPGIVKGLWFELAITKSALIGQIPDGCRSLTAPMPDDNTASSLIILWHAILRVFRLFAAMSTSGLLLEVRMYTRFLLVWFRCFNGRCIYRYKACCGHAMYKGKIEYGMAYLLNSLVYSIFSCGIRHEWSRQDDEKGFGQMKLLSAAPNNCLGTNVHTIKIWSDRFSRTGPWRE